MTFKGGNAIWKEEVFHLFIHKHTINLGSEPSKPLCSNLDFLSPLSNAPKYVKRVERLQDFRLRFFREETHNLPPVKEDMSWWLLIVSCC